MKSTINNKSISFGFYNGLGDFISEVPLFEWFYKSGYEVEIFVYEWLKEFATYIASFAKVKTIKDTKSISNIHIDTNYFFLSPGYIHKFSYSKTSFLSYIAKKTFLNSKCPNLIAVDNKDIYNYVFDIKKNYLDSHFFYASFYLLRQKFGMTYQEPFKIESKNYKKLFIFPFSGNEKKDYPLEKFVEIAEYFKKMQKYKVYIFVQEKDRLRLEDKFKNFLILSISLKEISEILDEDVIVLSNDSGPAHLGAYKGSGVVALYGVTDSQKYKPNGKGKVVTLQARNSDISTIFVQEVIDALNSF